jgi:hypothetical protein
MPSSFFVPKPPPLPKSLLFKIKKRPPNLNLTKNRSSTSSVSSSGTASPLSPTQTCTTPEVKAFLAALSLDHIENLITYNENSIKNGQNGVVKRVTLFVQGKTRELVKKQVRFGVERENKMTDAMQTVTAANFPFYLFALPVAQGSDGMTNILYTCYQEIGDLETHIQYIYKQYNLNPSAVLSYLFRGFQQLLEAINILDNSVFKDENGQTHQGIIHNDIKPSNIFLKTNGDFILGDFGCAYFKDEAAPQISTFQFSAPELFINKDFCTKSVYNLNTDLWSLGASLWYLLTNQSLSPILPSKSLSDIEKILFYRDWAENYSIQWQALIKDHLNLIGEQLVKQIRDTIDMDLKNLQTNFNNPQNTEQKRKILKKMALLMQAPASERPTVHELKELIDRLGDHFVIYGDTEEFAAQLLERKKSENPAYQESQNIKLPFSR